MNRNILKLPLGSVVALLVSLALLINSSALAVSFDRSYIASDSIFNDYGSMTASGINNFLNGFSSSCISPNNGFRAPDPTGYSPSTSYTYGSDVSAGTIIYHAAQAYKLNPKVILATLQKEQSLVTGTAGCSKLRYVGAMGNGCPDGGTTHDYSGFELYSLNGHAVTSVNGTCVYPAAAVGFSRQIITATWKLKFFQQRSLGNVAWAEIHGSWDNSDDPPTCYNGYMTPGTRARALGSGTSCDQSFSYDGKYTIDAHSVTMTTGATAALYYYTPHLSGNQNFFNIFTSWFGSPTSPCHATTNVVGQPSGRQILADQYARSGAANLAFTRLNNTGSACTEVHVWTDNFKGWQASVQTPLVAVDPSKGMMLTGNLTGSRRDELVYAKFASGGGNVEIHMLDSSFRSWISRTATNLANTSSSAGTFVAGDMNAGGNDNLMYIEYSGSSGQVEVYRWAAGYKAWASHGVTNLSAVSATSGQFVTGDMNGDGRDELMYVKYSGKNSRVEVYTWAAGYRSFVSDNTTNLDAINSNSGTFVAADTNDDGKDELMYVKYQGGSGQVEIHTWAPHYHEWASHQVTSLAGFDPTT